MLFVMVRKQNAEMTKQSLVVMLFSLLGLCSCSFNKENTLFTLDVEFVERITEFPDSSFFSDIRKMEYEDGKIYLLDVKRGDLVSLTEDFKQMEIVAPHSEIDLVMPASFAIEDDTICVYDYGSVKTMKVYAEGKQLRSMSSFRVKEMRMAMNDSFIWASAPTDTSCYIRLNRWNPDEFILYGKVEKEENAKRTMKKNSKHFLSVNNEMLYAVSEAYPLVDKYDMKSGALKESLDISNVFFIKENLEFAASQNLDPNSFFVHVTDACLYENEMYLLCPSLGMPYLCNMLLKIDVGGNEMRLVGYYELPGNVYRSICVSDEHLFVAFQGRDCAIEKYRLNDN